MTGRPKRAVREKAEQLEPVAPTKAAKKPATKKAKATSKAVANDVNVTVDVEVVKPRRGRPPRVATDAATPLSKAAAGRLEESNGEYVKKEPTKRAVATATATKTSKRKLDKTVVEASDTEEPTQKSRKHPVASATETKTSKRKLDKTVVEASDSEEPAQKPRKRAKVGRPTKAVQRNDDDDESDVGDASMMAPPTAVAPKKRTAATTKSKTARIQVAVKSKTPRMANAVQLPRITESSESASEATPKQRAIKKAVKPKVKATSKLATVADETPVAKKPTTKRKFNVDSMMDTTAQATKPTDDDEQLRDSGVQEDMFELPEMPEASVILDRLRKSQLPVMSPPQPVAIRSPLQPISARSSDAATTANDSVILIEREVSTIEISDTEEDNPCSSAFDTLLTDDGTEDEDEPETLLQRPAPPVWSLRENRMPFINEQAKINDQTKDKLFSTRLDVDLSEIFPGIDKKELNRRSSAYWPAMNL